MLNNQDEKMANNVEVLDLDEPIIIPEEENINPKINDFNNSNVVFFENSTNEDDFFRFNIPATPIVEEPVSQNNTSLFETPNVQENFNIPNFGELLENNEDESPSGNTFDENKFFGLIKEKEPQSKEESSTSSLNDINYDFSDIFKNENTKATEEFNFSPNFGIPNFDIPEVIEEPKKEETISETIGNNTFFTGDIKTVVNTIRNCTDTIEKYGFKVDSEEFDLEDMYQVVIKIHKK